VDSKLQGYWLVIGLSHWYWLYCWIITALADIGFQMEKRTLGVRVRARLHHVAINVIRNLIPPSRCRSAIFRDRDRRESARPCDMYLAKSRKGHRGLRAAALYSDRCTSRRPERKS